MKYYYPIMCGHTVKNPMICGKSNISEFGLKDRDFFSARIINKFDGRIKYWVDLESDDGDPDDVLQTIDMIPIFSERLVIALNAACIEGVQYIPVDVYSFKKTLITGFCIANVVKTVENAFNYEKSDYTLYPYDHKVEEDRGKMQHIWKYVLNLNAIEEGLDVFRLTSQTENFEWKRKYFVSERFKNVFTKNKFTGFSFQLIETV